MAILINEEITFNFEEEFDNNFSKIKERFQPFELQLNKEGGLKSPSLQPPLIVKNIYEQDSYVQEQHQGLFSEYLFIQNENRRKTYYEEKNIQQSQQQEYNQKCKENKVKVMICITMYSEPISELKKTLKGIEDSLQSFYSINYAPHQIAVFVIFDGIEKIRAQKDENGFFSEEDIIPYFKETFDTAYEIKGEQTLEMQYQIYKRKTKIKSSYSVEQIKQYEQQNMLDKKIEQDKELLRVDVKNLSYFQKKEYLNNQYKKAQDYVKDKQNNAWVYQNTFKKLINTQENNSIKTQKNEMPIFYVFKYSNGTKLSSHLWFFKGFCHEFNPKYCVLMDCGAVPKKNALFELINEMKNNKKIGGVCGKMTIQLNREQEKENDAEFMDPLSRFFNRVFSIERCQKFEYDLGNIFEKQLETTFNYVQVLPGAFSAYRYKAFKIQNNDLEGNTNNNQTILDEYLRSMLSTQNSQLTLEEANMFLAEDRILCLLLFCNNQYLKYVRTACVEVDACPTLIQLLFQRKRWINGSWFALNHVLSQFKIKLQNSKHSTCDKVKFIFCLVLASLSQILQYFAITFQLIWLYMVLYSITSELDPSIQFTLKSLGLFLYIFLVFYLIFLVMSYNPSITNQIKDERTKETWKIKINLAFYSKFYLISTIFGIYSILTLIYTISLIYNKILTELSLKELLEHPEILTSYLYLFIIFTLLFSLLPFFIQMFLDFQTFLDLIKYSLHYIYFMNAYTHLFQIYAFCRIDDLSWGTKGLIGDNSKVNNSYSLSKYKFVAKWICLNSLLITIIFGMFYMKIELLFQGLILTFTVILLLISFLRFLVLFYYQVKETIYCLKQKSNKVRQDPNPPEALSKTRRKVEQYRQSIIKSYQQSENQNYNNQYQSN
ncbi:unnamed protein product [Paramecium sonneborni]|uniref:chitin synthase n=1 Tax=Paramecium sonneborni TaxID=65129 RepID=A0A8S1KG38_9CILI|nr:unnamed protein product [Paramecium sonneborni]